MNVTREMIDNIVKYADENKAWQPDHTVVLMFPYGTKVPEDVILYVDSKGVKIKWEPKVVAPMSGPHPLPPYTLTPSYMIPGKSKPFKPRRRHWWQIWRRL